MNKINTVYGPATTARVYRDSEYDEYVVKFDHFGSYVEGADYHTDDKQDALDTAKYECYGEDC